MALLHAQLVIGSLRLSNIDAARLRLATCDLRVWRRPAACMPSARVGLPSCQVTMALKSTNTNTLITQTHTRKLARGTHGAGRHARAAPSRSIRPDDGSWQLALLCVTVEAEAPSHVWKLGKDTNWSEIGAGRTNGFRSYPAMVDQRLLDQQLVSSRAWRSKENLVPSYGVGKASPL